MLRLELCDAWTSQMIKACCHLSMFIQLRVKEQLNQSVSWLTESGIQAACHDDVITCCHDPAATLQLFNVVQPPGLSSAC